MFFHRHKPAFIISFVVLIFICCLFFLCCSLFWKWADLAGIVGSTSELNAIMEVQARYPGLNDYPNNSLPPRSIKTLNADGGWYLAFIQEGSGRPILEAKCYFVDKDKNVNEIGSYLPNNSDESPSEFSPKTCLPTNASNSSSSSADSASCQVINCHGMDIQCGQATYMMCTDVYQLGDRCIKHATCGIQNGVCGQTQNSAFDNCKSCVLDCQKNNQNDATKQFECEAKCE